MFDDDAHLPMTWASMPAEASYTNFGDALSPDDRKRHNRPVYLRKVPFRSATPRLAAIGTIAHHFVGGTVMSGVRHRP